MNQTLAESGRNILKELLSKCNDKHHNLFKRMYAHKTPDLPINDVVDKMDDDKIDWAITQCENTLNKA